MSAIPSNLARVSNQLASQIMLSSLQKTGQSLLHSQLQLASGKSLLRPSDDAKGASTVSVLDSIIERREQRMRNITHGESVLNTIDAALADGLDITMEAKSIGLSQLGVGSDAATRETQAVVIESMIREMVSIANRKYQQVHLFGGAATGSAPMQGLLGGWRYTGTSDGLYTDLGLALAVPITLSASKAFGAVSARVEGERDLDPALTLQTRLADLRGARGLGVSTGEITVDVGGTALSVDLSDAHTVQDVLDTLQEAIATVDPGAVVEIDPASQNALAITPSAGVTITISDLSADSIAADLGLNQTFPPGVTTAGGDLDPKLTELTPLSVLTGVDYPLGTIRLSNGGQVRELDLSGAETVRDVMTAVQALNIGIRVEISESADRLNFINELSGSPQHAMSIGEVAGGETAGQLGVRTLAGSTMLADFNNGLGVSIKTGSVDPLTGNPDPAADLDFRITLKDGRSFEVDLAGTLTVQDVLDAINAAADADGITPAEFTAHLATDGNGIALTDNTLPPGGTTSVTALNGSHAAEQLGILGSVTGSATLTGEDRATVAVDGLLSHLIALHDALKANDEAGIALATDRLEKDIDRLALARAEAGARSRRLLTARYREEDLQLQDMGLKSQVQDLDYTEAALRFSLLQQQLHAGLQTAGHITSMSLLDFLR